MQNTKPRSQSFGDGDETPLENCFCSQTRRDYPQASHKLRLCCQRPHLSRWIGRSSQIQMPRAQCSPRSSIRGSRAVEFTKVSSTVHWWPMRRESKRVRMNMNEPTFANLQIFASFWPECMRWLFQTFLLHPLWYLDCRAAWNRNIKNIKANSIPCESVGVRNYDPCTMEALALCKKRFNFEICLCFLCFWPRFDPLPRCGFVQLLSSLLLWQCMPSTFCWMMNVKVMSAAWRCFTFGQRKWLWRKAQGTFMGGMMESLMNEL